MIVVGGVIAILAVVTLSVKALDEEVFVDSGVSACQQMVENMQKPKTDVEPSKMTEAEYKERRGSFERSNYADLRAAGTSFVDTVYNASNTPEDSDNFGGALLLLTTLNVQFTALKTACGNYGVELPALQT